MIFTSNGDVVLQQRSWNKMTGPGKWDMPGGHQVFGQTIEQCAASELMEEMGISVNLKLIRKGLYQSETQSEFYYLFAGISNGPYGFDKNEVEQVRIFECEQLLKRNYPEANDVLDHVYSYIEELRYFWKPLTKQS
jgi:8-oxo-dGTP pyrophosphatase MutT (NUDIX family)